MSIAGKVCARLAVLVYLIGTSGFPHLTVQALEPTRPAAAATAIALSASTFAGAMQNATAENEPPAEPEATSAEQRGKVADLLKQATATDRSAEERAEALAQSCSMLQPMLNAPVADVAPEVFVLAAQYAVVASDHWLAATIVAASNSMADSDRAPRRDARTASHGSGPLPDAIAQRLVAMPDVSALVGAASARLAGAETLWQGYGRLFADTVFAEAESAIQAIGDPELQEWKRGSLVEGLVEADRFDWAQRVAAAIADPENRLDAMAAICAGLTDEGRFEEALALLGPMKNLDAVLENEEWFPWSSRAMFESVTAHLAMRLALADRLPDALNLIASIAEDADRFEALSKVAWRLAKEGDVEIAQAVVERITDMEARQDALRSLVYVLSEEGRLAPALRIAIGQESLGDRAWCIGSLLEQMIGDDAETADSSHMDLRRQVIHELERASSAWIASGGGRESGDRWSCETIARVLAEAGAISSAQRFVRQIENPMCYIAASSKVVQVLKNTDREQDAHRLTNEIVTRSRRDRQIALQAPPPSGDDDSRVDDPAAVAAAIDESVVDALLRLDDVKRASEVTQSIENEVTRGRLQHRICVAALHAGDLDGATRYALQIRAPAIRASALSTIANSHFDAGRHDEGRSVFNLALSDLASIGHGGDAFYSRFSIGAEHLMDWSDIADFARAAGRAGRLDALQQIVSKVDSAEEREAMLTRVARDLAQRHQLPDMARAIDPDFDVEAIDDGEDDFADIFDEEACRASEVAYEGRYPGARLVALELEDPESRAIALIDVGLIAAVSGSLREDDEDEFWWW